MRSISYRVLLIIFILSCYEIIIKAQGFSIQGYVKEGGTKEPLVGAHVILQGKSQYAMITNLKGMFQFTDIEAGNYLIRITYLGYKEYKKQLLHVTDNLNLEEILLIPVQTPIEEVQIEGKTPIAIVKGDTIQYHSDAFKTNPDASAEDLIKKMPGMVVQDGKVQAQGEDVKKVTVDGKPFFDQDPTLALRTLPAEVIEKIQVFDEQSQQAQFTGFNDGQSSKTINIITRNNMQKGQFGKIYGGYGYEKKYQAGGNVNLFKNDSRLSIIALSNNINIQNFSSEDLLGIMGTGGRRGSPMGGGMPRGDRPEPGGGSPGQGTSPMDYMVGPQSGISATHALGMNYSDKWGEKINVSGSYFFNYSNNESQQLIHQDYFTSGDSLHQLYEESSTSSSDNYNQRLFMKLEYKINPANSLIVIPRLSLQTNNAISEANSQSYHINDTLNQTQNLVRSNLTGYNLSNEFLFMHKFNKEGRTISLNLDTKINAKNGDSYQISQNISHQNTDITDSLNQYSKTNNDGSSLAAQVVYTEPLAKNSQLMLNYRSSYEWNDADRKTYNSEDYSGLFNIIDTSLSNTFKSVYQTQQIGTGYSYRKDNLFIMAGSHYQYAVLNNKRIFPDDDTWSYHFNSILPMIHMRYKVSQTKNIDLFYRTQSNLPSINQLQNVLDNSNPLQQTVGNPELKQELQQSIFLRYSSSNTSRSTLFFTLVAINNKNDYIANSILFANRDTTVDNGISLSQGSQLTKPVTLDGYFNIRSFTTYGFPANFLKSNINLNITYNLTRIPGKYNGLISYSYNHTYSLGWNMGSNINRHIDFTLSSNSSYNVASNSLQIQSENTYFVQNAVFKINLIFLKNVVLQSELDYQTYQGLSADYNQDYYLWNLSIGKKFFKEDKGEIKITVFDVLAQNTSIQRNVTESYIEDIQTQVLKQYVLVTFSYKLKNFNV